MNLTKKQNRTNWFEKSIRLIFISAVLIRFIYLVITPLGQAPDEIFHFERIYYEKLTLYRINTNSPVWGPNTELVHPPLYYWINKIFLVVLIRLLGLPSENLVSSFINYGVYLRLINLIFSITTLFLWKKFLEKLALPKYLFLISLIIIYFIPTLVGSSFSINIDSLYLFFTSCVHFYLADLINKINYKKVLKVGIFTALALLTKLYSIGLIFSVIYLLLYKYRNKPYQFFKFILVYLLPIFLLTGWWFVNNLLYYGEPFATEILRISTITNIKPFAFQGYVLMFLWWSFQTFWVSFGVTNNIRIANSLYIILFLMMVYCLINKGKENKKILQLPIYYSLAIFFLLNFLQMVYLNFWISFQPQGRYLFAGLPFYGIMLSLGITKIFSKNNIRKGVLLVILTFIILHIFSLNCLLWYYLNIHIIPQNLVCKFY